jgi:hypothetical protein
MTVTLESLPPALLERHVCVFLDAASLARFELGASRELRAEIRCSGLWAALVARHFGLTDLPKFASRLPGGDNALVGWKRVFVAAQQDAQALATVVDEEAALRVCEDRRVTLALALRSRERSIRDELALMQALRRFPTSNALVAAYARMLTEVKWAERVAGGAESRRRGLPLVTAPTSPRVPLPLAVARP